MKREKIEIKRAERVNEYGVKIINRLVEVRTIFKSTGKVHSKEYFWERDTIQRNGDKYTAQVEHFKQYAAMQRAMNRYHFDDAL